MILWDGGIVRIESISVHIHPVKKEETFINWKAALSFMHIAHINDITVCQLHFKESDYKTGKTSREGAVIKWRVLKSDSVTSVFSTIPKLLQKSLPTPQINQRAAASVRKDLLKFEADKMEIEMLRSLKVDDNNDLKVKLCD